MTASGAEPIADAGAALGRLIESLVISYSLDLGAATFTLVADYPDRDPGAQRSFVALRFSSVRGFRRYPGNLAELQASTDTYSTADSPRPIVIQHLSTTGGDDGRCVELSFGPTSAGSRSPITGWQGSSATPAPKSATVTGSTATRAPARHSTSRGRSHARAVQLICVRRK